MSIPKHILPTIVLAQFGCTSLWFAGNAVVDDLSSACSLASDAIGHLTAAVQLGFIAGTLCFALLAINDRFAPSKIFMLCASIGAGVNLLMMSELNGLISLCSIRVVTGFCLAGVYPVGMKIAADYYQKGLGRSLGFLVGALVLGTAFPHLLNGLTIQLPWKQVIIGTSALAFAGGLSMLLFVPDGPHRQVGQAIRFKGISSIFKSKPFKTAAFGYFGHMWELYAFWTFVPIILASTLGGSINISFWSFVIIGVGSLSCVLGGLIAERRGTSKTAFGSLLASGICCALSPLLLGLDNPVIIIGFLIFWGMVVIADSPLFSTLVAQNANPQIKGTALTIVNCIGFSLTIVSIQLLNYLRDFIDIRYLMLVLVIGPIWGLWGWWMQRKALTVS